MTESSPSMEQIEQAMSVLGTARPEALPTDFVYRVRAWHEQEVLRLNVDKSMQDYNWFADLD